MTALELARDALSRRATLPRDPVEWGRSWNLSPAEAGKLVRAEQMKRSTT